MSVDLEASDLNYVIVNGIPTPGRCKISGAALTFDWDIKKGHGMVGATTVFTGRAPVEFTLTLEFWNNEQLLEWEAGASKLFQAPKPLGLKAALGIKHPLLDELGLTGSFVVKKRGQLELNANGLHSIQIELLEWFPKPKPALVKPKTAVPAVEQDVLPAKTAGDMALVEMQKEFNDWQAAANGPSR